MKNLKLSIVILVSAALAACASSGSNAAAVKDEVATVVVDNRAILDMNIYVLRSGQRVRLGTATGLTKTRLKIPTTLLMGSTFIRFLADPIGSNRTPVSEEISVSPGDEVELMIPPTG